MFFMRVLGCLSVLLFALAVVAEEPPTELKIDRTYVPEDCKVTSQKGDRLHMHYVSVFHSVAMILYSLYYAQTGKLWTNGNKFDSRSVL